MGISRSGFTALVDAVWNLLPVASRQVHLATTSPGVIKNIQRGTITLGPAVLVNTFTLTPAVNTGKTEISHLGQRVDANVSANVSAHFATVDITGGGTTAQAERGVVVAGANLFVQWQTREEN